MVLGMTDVLKAISEEETLELFRIVALTKPDANDIIKSKTRLTRKQYYSRMSKLTRAGLIKRKQGKYSLTTFGKVVYDIILIKIQNAINNYWKLKAIDSLEMSNDLPLEERKKLFDELIDNQEIKDILVSDADKANKSKFESDQPSLGREQQQKQSIHQN
jgi:DNA-binding Lrp family transcriptional regulator